jgi:hypothetical protein
MAALESRVRGHTPTVFPGSAAAGGCLIPYDKSHTSPYPLPFLGGSGEGDTGHSMIFGVPLIFLKPRWERSRPGCKTISGSARVCLSLGSALAHVTDVLRFAKVNHFFGHVLGMISNALQTF